MDPYTSTNLNNILGDVSKVDEGASTETKSSQLLLDEHVMVSGDQIGCFSLSKVSDIQNPDESQRPELTNPQECPHSPEIRSSL